jgi:hypothetical protein
MKLPHPLRMSESPDDSRGTTFSPLVSALTLCLTTSLASNTIAQTTPFPDNLVVDLRVFEARSSNPDLPTLNQLSYFVNTDGREATANQWLATLANKIDGAWLAQLAYETVPVAEGRARLRLPNGSRSFNIDIDFDSFNASGLFKAQATATLTRAGNTLRRFEREVDFQLGRTSLWSGSDLEIALTDYISHFREYRGREGRGLLFEQLRAERIHLILAATPRLCRDEETGQLAPSRLTLPAGTEIPDLDNPYDVPMNGTVLVGFELDAEGAPVNPQIIRTTLPEANPHILRASLDWRFALAARATGNRMWGQVEVEVELTMP